MMMKNGNRVFKRLINNLIILQPDLGSQFVLSFLECAFLCGSQDACSTLIAYPQNDGFNCQLSIRKGSCMERKETTELEGSRIYQHKVRLRELLTQMWHHIQWVKYWVSNQ
jgi:hypothetical protein